MVAFEERPMVQEAVDLEAVEEVNLLISASVNDSNTDIQADESDNVEKHITPPSLEDEASCFAAIQVLAAAVKESEAGALIRRAKTPHISSATNKYCRRTVRVL